mmetsp:Transcript_16125/g.40979  ORF Transcript_16125/g.40979 Transcript_16125/m.40979 type:complete len:238 (-) Transcript_16125:1185-1898(-)
MLWRREVLPVAEGRPGVRIAAQLLLRARPDLRPGERAPAEAQPAGRRPEVYRPCVVVGAPHLLPGAGGARPVRQPAPPAVSRRGGHRGRPAGTALRQPGGDAHQRRADEGRRPLQGGGASRWQRPALSQPRLQPDHRQAAALPHQGARPAQPPAVRQPAQRHPPRRLHVRAAAARLWRRLQPADGLHPSLPALHARPAAADPGAQPAHGQHHALDRRAEQPGGTAAPDMSTAGAARG